MAGLNKRAATYVPQHHRQLLDKLSKADLMEIVWDFAMIATGEADTATDDEVYSEIVQIHQALRFNGWQGSVKLPGSD